MYYPMTGWVYFLLCFLVFLDRTVVGFFFFYSRNTIFHFCKTFSIILFDIYEVEVKPGSEPLMLLLGGYKLTQFYRKAV